MMDRKLMERYGLIPPSATPTPSSATYRSAVKREKKALDQKLDQIALDEVLFDGLPLSEVLKFLYEKSRDLDSDQRGVNFLISNAVQSPTPTAVDPMTGIPAPPPEPFDMGNVIVRFTLPLRDVRLKDVLDAIVKVAEHPIQYSVEDYGVVFSRNPDLPGPASAASSPAPYQAPSGLEPLGVRTFRIDKNQLVSGLENAFGISIDTTTKTSDLDKKRKEIRIRIAEREISELERKVEAGAAQPAQLENARNALEMLKATSEKERLQAQLRIAERQLETLSRMAQNGRASKLDVEKAQADKELIELELAELEKKGEPKSLRLTQTRDLMAALRSLFSQLGVNLDGPGKGLFYNEKSGLLMVRANLADLDVIQAAIETLGGSAAQTSDIAPAFGAGYASSVDGPMGFGMAGSTQNRAGGFGAGFGGFGASGQRPAAETLLDSQPTQPMTGGHRGDISTKPQSNEPGATIEPDKSGQPSSPSTAQNQPPPPAQSTIAVLGEVKKPGLYTLPPQTSWTIIEAIAAAGGLGPKANSSKIELTHNGKTDTYKFDDLRKKADPSKSIKLQPGDVIYVRENFL